MRWRSRVSVCITGWPPLWRLGNSSRSVAVLRRSLPATVGLVAITSEARFGTALGLKSSASSLGQFLGPSSVGSMLAWRASPDALRHAREEPLGPGFLSYV